MVPCGVAGVRVDPGIPESGQTASHRGAGARSAPADAGREFVSRAVFRGVVACVSRPAPELERTLPRELSLADRGEGDGLHPVLVFSGEQTRGASRIAGREVEWNGSYEELIVAIPFVRPRRREATCVYPVAMYSSFWVPNWWGLHAFGYGKRPGRVVRHGAIHSLTTPEAGLAFQAVTEPRGPWCAAQDDPTGLVALLRRVGELPWVGQRPGGSFVRSRARWEFQDANVRPVAGRAELHRPVFGGLATGVWPLAAEATAEIEGMTWWLSWPRRMALAP